MATKRKRSQNFTFEEKHRLLKLLATHKETILNKRTDGFSNEAKNKAWMDIYNKFNNSATIHRPKDSLVKIWEKFKTESKLYYQSTRDSGNNKVVRVDPILEQVCVLLGLTNTDIPALLTYSEENVVVEVENAHPEQHCVFQESSDSEDDTTANTECERKLKISQEDYCISNTPHWSRKRPRLSQSNERADTTSSPCTNLKNGNQKKEDIQDLKRKLLQEEIDFKRKLYELQLQAAAKEVEIKTEILNQLIGGTMNIHNLFGKPPDM